MREAAEQRSGFGSVQYELLQMLEFQYSDISIFNFLNQIQPRSYSTC